MLVRCSVSGTGPGAALAVASDASAGAAGVTDTNGTDSQMIFGTGPTGRACADLLALQKTKASIKLVETQHKGIPNLIYIGRAALLARSIHILIIGPVGPICSSERLEQRSRLFR